MTTRREFMRRSAVMLGGSAVAAAAPGADKPQAASPLQATDSHVGSLYPFIRSQAPREFSLSFLRDEFNDLDAWKGKARGKLLELLHYAPPRCEPRPEIVDTADRGDYIQEKVYFNTTPDIRVPAAVLIPKNGKKPFPAVVALHDHGGFYLWGREKLLDNPNEHPFMTDFKKQYYAGSNIAVDLVRQGYVVIVIDMFYWGERRMLLDDDPADWRDRPRDITAQRISAFNQRASQSEQLVGRTIYSTGFTWAGVIFWDDVRTVDYLLTRPEVDPQRIGCVGLSVGALRSCHLAALDDRIKAAVVVGWMASFPTQLQKKIRNTIGHTKLVPGLYRFLDYPDVASLAMPAALLVINGSQDGLFELDGVRASFEKLRACYQKAGIREKFQATLYDSPHQFNAAMQDEAWAWLKKWV